MPGLRALRYAYYNGDERVPIAWGRLDLDAQAPALGEMLKRVLRHTREADYAADRSAQPRITAVAATYGGDQYPGPAVYTPEVVGELKRLIPQWICQHLGQSLLSVNL